MSRLSLTTLTLNDTIFLGTFNVYNSVVCVNSAHPIYTAHDDFNPIIPLVSNNSPRAGITFKNFSISINYLSLPNF